MSDHGEARVDQRASPRRLEIWLPLVIVVIDQITKALVRAHVPLHESVTVVPGLHGFHARAATRARRSVMLNAADFPFKTAVISDHRAGAIVGVGLYAASLAAPSAVRADRPGAHHRRGRRQPDRPHDRRIGR